MPARRGGGALEQSHLRPGLLHVAFKLRIPQRKPWQAMADDVGAAAAVMATPERVMYGVPKGKEGTAQQLNASISSGLRGVLGAIDAK